MSDRIDIYLRTVPSRLAALPDIERHLANPPASAPAVQQRVDRSDVREGWDLAMASLEWLDEAYAAARMSGRQAEQYSQLTSQIHDALPGIRKLGLALPPSRVLRRADVTRRPGRATASG
jgi:hypothetical protein